MRTPFLASIGLVLLLAPAFGMGGGALDLTWHTVDGGGGTSTAPGLSLTGTIGQHDAGAVMSGGSFTFEGGFWAFVPSSGACVGDLNSDGVVNSGDLAALLSGWGTGAGDIDGDGITNSLDLAALLGAWGPCP